MNVTAERSFQSPWRATIASAPSPFWHRHHGRRRPEACETGRDRLDIRALAGDDHEVRLRQRVWRRRRDDACGELGATADLEPLRIQAASVLLAPRQH